MWMLIIGLMAASEASGTQDKVTKTEAEWRKVLSKDEFHILREKGTERAFTGKYWDSKAKGVYRAQVPLGDRVAQLLPGRQRGGRRAGTRRLAVDDPDGDCLQPL